MSHSIVIPVHNEAAHLEELVADFIARLTAAAGVSDIVIVENGSTDGTRGAAERLAARYAGLVRALGVPRPSYGAAVRHGLLASTGAHCSILECDHLDADFVVRSRSLLLTGEADLVIASKRHPEAVDRRPLVRRLLTWGFNLWLRALLGYPGSDTHGLKSMETALARRLCELSVTSDEAFQTEIVLLAWRLGYRIRELPLSLHETRPTPVSVLRRVPKVLPIFWQLRRSLRRFPVRRGGP